MTTVTVVTPWHDHREHEQDYWAALRSEDCEVIVVDNGSEPPLPNAWRLDFNSGFNHACNVGLELATTDIVVFLNNDIEASQPGWLKTLADAVEPGVLVGPRLRYDRHGDVDDKPFPYLDGWCLAGLRADLLELGGWDETFEEPAYYGDNDLCLRARAHGMRLREIRVPGLRHKGNGTLGPEPSELVRAASAANYETFAGRARDLVGASMTREN